MASFRDREDREERIDAFLKEVKDLIYVKNMSFDPGTDYDHWMDAGIDIPLVSVHCNVILEYYYQLRGTTCIVISNGENEVNVDFGYEILPPSTLNSMVVYNGENSFKYLASYVNSHPVMNHRKHLPIL